MVVRKKKKQQAAEVVVIAECIRCKGQKEIRAGEVAKDDVPMCEKCMMPCVAIKAETRAKK